LGGILWSLFFLVLFWAVVYLISPDLLRELFEYTP